MKAHKGMRPQDIVVLLKIILLNGTNWMNKDLARELYLSPSEISESINRSMIAGLIAPDKRRVNRQPLLEFLVHGLPYVFPQQAGALVRGVPTAHSALPLKELINSNSNFVWPSAMGNITGQSIEPLYANAVKAAQEDEHLYAILALLDAIRAGLQRERQLATEELKKALK